MPDLDKRLIFICSPWPKCYKKGFLKR
uniref:Uncharacterized protein n=1 Tax=Anguilla anguilla TaxID=7936 RepID=A0A0E9XA73_ANGAN